MMQQLNPYRGKIMSTILRHSNPQLGSLHRLLRFSSIASCPPPLLQTLDNDNDNDNDNDKKGSSFASRVLPLMDAVVKLFCVHKEPDYSMPWQMKKQRSSSSTAFAIHGNRLLTCAYSVKHHTQLKLKKRGSDTLYPATVLAIGTDCDIALLSVNDDEFWKGVSPLELGQLPDLEDAVSVVGYPTGVDTSSVTNGVISRIEIMSYHCYTHLLGLKINATINSGNFGGPAFNDKGKCVGIAFKNTGNLIPTPVITHFIQDYDKNGAYTGFPTLGSEWEKLQNPDLRMSLGMKSNQKGVRITRVHPTSFESNVLSPSDVILSFDGVDIDNDGTVPFRHGERIGLSHLISRKYTQDVAEVNILRNSVMHKFCIKLGTCRRLVDHAPSHIEFKPPSYYIVAGFVFMDLSIPYLHSEYGENCRYAPVKLRDKLEMRQSADEEVVVVSQVLGADINIGYEDIEDKQVVAFNGNPVKNLKSLAHMVEACEDEFIKFEFDRDQVVVLRTKSAKAATADILTTHCIPSAMSDDLKQ